MEPLHEALRLIKRQTELENAMRRPGGIRVTEERELFQLRHALTQYPAAVTAIVEAAARMWSSSPEESHPQALTQRYVNLSIHTAPIVQPLLVG